MKKGKSKIAFTNVIQCLSYHQNPRESAKSDSTVLTNLNWKEELSLITVPPHLKKWPCESFIAVIIKSEKSVIQIHGMNQIKKNEIDDKITCLSWSKDNKKIIGRKNGKYEILTPDNNAIAIPNLYKLFFDSFFGIFIK